MRSKAYALVGFILTSLAFLSCTSPSSPYEKAQAQYHQQLSAIQEFQDARGQRSEQEAATLSWQLSRQGLRRLSDEQLLRRVSLKSKMLAPVPNGTCAAIVRDTPTEAQLKEALEKLDSENLELFFTLSAEAVRAELQHHPPPTVIGEAEFPTAFGALLSALPEEQAERLAALLSRGPAQTSDEEVCWAERTFLNALLSLNEPHRSLLARAVVQ
jgi:hypothetical protein